MDQNISDAEIEEGSIIWDLQELDPLVGLNIVEIVLQICEDNPAIKNDKRIHDEILGLLGAGPFEDLFDMHWSVLMEAVLQKARIEPNFRQMLASAWQGSIPDQEWQRVDAVVGRV